LRLVDEQADVFSFNQQTSQAFQSNTLDKILGQTVNYGQGKMP